MSVPRSIRRPERVSSTVVSTPRVDLVTWTCRPDGDSRGTVVLVHGFAGSKEDFVHALGLIADRGWTAIALDQRGQHESLDPDDADAYDVATFGADLVAAIDALDGPVHLVGHSFGGLVARAATLASPSAIRTLTLLDSGPAALPEQHVGSIRQFSAAITTMGHEPVWQYMRQQTLADHPDVQDEVLEFLELRFKAGSVKAHDAVARILTAEPDRTPDLAATGVPLLVAYGTLDDVWSPDEQAAMASRLGAEVAVLDGLGHSPAVEDPERVVAALDAFWSRHDTRASSAPAVLSPLSRP